MCGHAAVRSIFSEPATLRWTNFKLSDGWAAPSGNSWLVIHPGYKATGHLPEKQGELLKQFLQFSGRCLQVNG
jgi:hypothetical protein